MDTGFFFAFKNGNDKAVELYNDILEGRQLAAVSSITLFEVRRHALRGRLDREYADDIFHAAGVGFRYAGVDSRKVLNRAARISHGMGLSMADALIAASLERVNCTSIYTKDSDFEAYHGSMEVIFL